MGNLLTALPASQLELSFCISVKIIFRLLPRLLAGNLRQCFSHNSHQLPSTLITSPPNTKIGGAKIFGAPLFFSYGIEKKMPARSEITSS